MIVLVFAGMLLASASAHAVGWETLGPSGGAVAGIAAGAGNVYVYAYPGRLFRWDDQGARWVELAVPRACNFQGFPLAPIQVRADADVFLHCDPVVRSRDAGQTWSLYGPEQHDDAWSAR